MWDLQGRCSCLPSKQDAAASSQPLQYKCITTIRLFWRGKGGKKNNQSNLKVSGALDPLQQQFESVSQSLRSWTRVPFILPYPSVRVVRAPDLFAAALHFRDPVLLPCTWDIVASLRWSILCRRFWSGKNRTPVIRDLYICTHTSGCSQEKHLCKGRVSFRFTQSLNAEGSI